MTAAAAATAALGLADDGALERATNAQLAELPHAEAMAAALWPGLSGYYLDALMQVGLARPTGRGCATGAPTTSAAAASYPPC